MDAGGNSLENDLTELWNSTDVRPDPEARRALRRVWPDASRFVVSEVRVESIPVGDYLVKLVHENEDRGVAVGMLHKVSRRLWETQIKEVANDLAKYAEQRFDEASGNS